MSRLKTSIAFGALVGAAAIPLGAAALETQTASEQAASVASADAQVVARDPATGKLRPATAEEVQALHRSRAQLRASGGVTSASHSHWSGARGARLTEEFMNYSVVVRTADGKLVELCVEDPATLTSKAAPAKSSTLPTE